MSGENSANDPIAVPPANSLSPAGSTPPAAPAVAPAVALRPENVVRGFLLSLLAVPAGVIVFLVIWNLGFIASIVGFGVALLAVFLYRLGSGGRVSMRGAVIVALVTLGTLVIAFLFAEVSDIATVNADAAGVSWFEMLTTPGFLGYALGLLFSPQGMSAVAGDAALTLLFGLLGCAAVVIGAFREARNATAAPVVPPATPPAI